MFLSLKGPLRGRALSASMSTWTKVRGRGCRGKPHSRWSSRGVCGADHVQQSYARWRGGLIQLKRAANLAIMVRRSLAEALMIFNPFSERRMDNRFPRKKDWRSRAPSPRHHFDSVGQLKARCTWSIDRRSAPKRRIAQNLPPQPAKRRLTMTGEI